MSETTMPAAEAEGVTGDDERSSYELAFHVLPTVAEGEVTAVFDTIKSVITNAEGEIFDEEAPERFELAYEIVKHLEGKNRKFSSAYFGWVRFKNMPGAIEAIGQEVEGNSNILRHFVIKLTKVEEANPFRLHESLTDQKQVTTVEESEVVPDLRTATEPESEHKEEEKSSEVSDVELEKALEEKDV